MSIFATNNRQLIFIYSETCPLIAEYLQLLQKVLVPIRIINIDREELAEDIWIDISKMLKMKLSEIFERKDFNLNEINSEKLFSNRDWLDLIGKGMYNLKFPIAIYGNNAEIIKTPSEISQIYADTGSTIILNNKQRKSKHYDK